MVSTDIQDEFLDRPSDDFDVFPNQLSSKPLGDRVGRDSRCRLSVVIPAHNEEVDIEQVVRGVWENLRRANRPFFEILVVDDGSSDRTRILAEDAGARVLRHPYGIGNGAAVKAGFRAAIGEVTVVLDGDGQHDPRDIPRLLLALNDHAMVVGARRKESRSSFHRRWANRAYNVFASYVASRPIPDLTSGFRAVRTDIARRYLYLLPNTFSSPSTLTLSLIRSGHPVGFVPILTRGRSEGTSSKIRLIRDGGRFMLLIMRVATLFSPFKVFLPISVSVFGLGIGYYIYTYVTAGRFTNMGLLLLILSWMIFSLGLISEQVASLRFDRTEEIQ